MAQAGLEKFLGKLIDEIERLPNSEGLRKEYDLEPHTFLFEPKDLSDVMVQAAMDSNQTDLGWTPSSTDKEYMVKQALVYGAKLVAEVKAIGGDDYGTAGVSILVTGDSDIPVVPSGTQYRQAGSMNKKQHFFKVTGAMMTVDTVFNKIKGTYRTQLDAYFKDLQAHFGKSNIEGTRKKQGFREKSKDGKEKRSTSGASNKRGEAGHAHGDGVLETGLARAFSTVGKDLSADLDAEGLDISGIQQMLQQQYQVDISCVRDLDHEGFVIKLEYGPGNRAEGKAAQKKKEAFLLACKNAVASIGATNMSHLSGSDSIVDRNRKLIIKQVTDEFKKARKVRVKHENTKLKPSKGKASTTVGKVKLGREKKMSMAGVALAAPRARRVAKRSPKAPRMALKNLLALLNSKLPQQVASNMGSPQLENRTGRFAQSVRATDVTETAKGFQSVGYTYARKPYEIYESTSGSRFASSDRDPRTLIDTSIREIAAQFGLGRLFTRRL